MTHERIQPSDLTPAIVFPRLERGGVIMPGESGRAEGAATVRSRPAQRIPTGNMRPLRGLEIGRPTPDNTVRPGEVRAAWQEHYREQGIEDIATLPFEERQSIQAAIARGATPRSARLEGDRMLRERSRGTGMDLPISHADIAGFNPAAYTDDIIGQNAQDVVDQVIAGRADEDFLDSIAAEVRRVRNNNPGNPTLLAEAQDLLNNVQGWRQRAVELTLERQRIQNERARGIDPVLGAAWERYRGLGAHPPQHETVAIVEAIKAYLEGPDAPAPDAGRFNDAFFEMASKLREVREMLINRIIFKPFDDTSERNDYRLDLYAEDNLKRLIETSRHDPDDPNRERYQALLKLRTAAELMHTMNNRILAGTLEEFTRIAERIDIEHFEVMSHATGVGQVMRLYDQVYQEELARGSRIYDYKAVKTKVEQRFRELCKNGLVESEYADSTRAVDKRHLEEWEIERALHVGRTFFNVTFRAAEQISSGEIPTDFHDKFASIPMESAVKLMNHIQWVSERFHVGESRGGFSMKAEDETFIKILKRTYDQINEERGNTLGINRIVRLGNLQVENIQYAGYFKIAGVYSGWRMENLAFPKIKVPGTTISLLEWFEEKDPHHIDPKTGRPMARKKVIGEIRDDPDEHHPIDPHSAEAQRRRHELAMYLRPIIEHSHLGLGMLLAHSSVSGKFGYEARKMIWERVAQVNVPTMINYLTNIQMADATLGIRTMDQLKTAVRGVNWDADIREPVRDVHGRDTGQERKLKRWDRFMEKLQAHHERSIREAMQPGSTARATVDPFTAQEQQLIALVQHEGAKLAPHLADIYFPWVPFMNDMPFEDLAYSEARGPRGEFYKRRVVTDFGGFYGAQHAQDEIQDAPGALPMEKLLEAMKKFEAGLSNPLGTEMGIKESQALVETMDEMLKTQNIGPFRRSMVIKAIQQEFEKPTSLAQKWAGMQAETLDEHQRRKFLEDLVKIGVVSEHMMKELRKKKKLNWPTIWKALFQDLFPIIFAIGIKELLDESMEDSIPGVIGGGGGHHD